MKKILIVTAFILLLTTFVYAIRYEDIKSNMGDWKLIEVNNNYIVYQKTICQKWEKFESKNDILSYLSEKSGEIINIDISGRCVEWKTLEYVDEVNVKYTYSCFNRFYDYECDSISDDGRVCYIDSKEIKCIISWKEIIDDSKIKTTIN